MTAKERLTEKLKSLTIKGKNKKKLFAYFGEDNLKQLPFNTVKKKTQESTQDGISYRKVNLLTGDVSEYNSFTDYVLQPNITDNDLIWIEDKIFKELDEIENNNLSKRK